MDFRKELTREQEYAYENMDMEEAERELEKLESMLSYVGDMFDNTDGCLQDSKPINAMIETLQDNLTQILIALEELVGDAIGVLEDNSIERQERQEQEDKDYQDDQDDIRNFVG